MNFLITGSAFASLARAGVGVAFEIQCDREGIDFFIPNARNPLISPDSKK
jgi:hypothetical protein